MTILGDLNKYLGIKPVEKKPTSTVVGMTVDMIRNMTKPIKDSPVSSIVQSKLSPLSPQQNIEGQIRAIDKVNTPQFPDTTLSTFTTNDQLASDFRKKYGEGQYGPTELKTGPSVEQSKIDRKRFEEEESIKQSRVFYDTAKSTLAGLVASLAGGAKALLAFTRAGAEFQIPELMTESQKQEEKLKKDPTYKMMMNAIDWFGSSQESLAKIPDGSFQKEVFNIAQSSGSFGIGLAAFALTKNPELVVGLVTAMDSFDTYNKSRDAGLSPADSLKAMTADASITFALERFGWNMLIGRWKKPLAKYITESVPILSKYPVGTAVSKNISGAFLTEGTQEGLQTIWQNLVAKNSYDKSRKLVDGLVESILIGGALGGGATAVNQAVQINADQANIKNAVDELTKQGLPKPQAEVFAKYLLDYTKGYVDDIKTKTESSFKESRLVGYSGGTTNGRPGIETPATFPKGISKEERALSLLDGNFEGAGFVNRGGIWVDKGLPEKVGSQIDAKLVAELKAQGIEIIEVVPKTATGIEYGQKVIGGKKYGVIKIGENAKLDNTVIPSVLRHEAGHGVYFKLTLEEQAFFRKNYTPSGSEISHQVGRTGGQLSREGESFADFVRYSLEGTPEKIPSKVRPLVEKYTQSVKTPTIPKGISKEEWIKEQNNLYKDFVEKWGGDDFSKYINDEDFLNNFKKVIPTHSEPITNFRKYKETERIINYKDILKYKKVFKPYENAFIRTEKEAIDWVKANRPEKLKEVLDEIEIAKNLKTTDGYIPFAIGYNNINPLKDGISQRPLSVSYAGSTAYEGQRIVRQFGKNTGFVYINKDANVLPIRGGKYSAYEQELVIPIGSQIRNIQTGYTGFGTTQVDTFVDVPSNIKTPSQLSSLYDEAVKAEGLPSSVSTETKAELAKVAEKSKSLAEFTENVAKNGGISYNAKEYLNNRALEIMKTNPEADYSYAIAEAWNEAKGLPTKTEGANVEVANKPTNESTKEQVSISGEVPAQQSTGVQENNSQPTEVGQRTGESGRGLLVRSGERSGARTSRIANEQARKLVSEKQTFSEDEKVILRNYSGAGGLEKAGETGRGLLDEYYTPPKVVDKMWGLARKHGFVGGEVLEPSAGIGRFVERGPSNAKYDVYEIDETSSKIARALLGDNANVVNAPFESLFIDKGGSKVARTKSYDLVIGNPPYGEHRGYYKGLGEESNIRKYEEYFIKKGIDVLKEDGVLVMVVPSGFLKGGTNKAKEAIAEIGTLEEAYRLPEGTFDTTKIGTDIIVFKKSTPASPAEEATRFSMLVGDSYFANNPAKVLGETKTRKNRFGVQEEYVARNDEDPLDKISLTEAQDSGPKVAEETTITEAPKEKNKEALVEEYGGLKTKGQVFTTQHLTDSQKQIWKSKTADGSIDISKIDKDLIKELNQYKGKYFDDFDYLQGNIYEKLDILENETVQDKEKQKAKLDSILPARIPFDKIYINPKSSFAEDFKMKTEEGMEGLEATRASLVEDFESYLRELPDEAFAPSRKYETMGYLFNQRIDAGKNKVLAAQIKQRRKNAAERLFVDYLKGIDPETKQRIEEDFNRTKNGFVAPDYKKVPLFIDGMDMSFGGKGLKMKEYKLDSIGFLSNRGTGINANGVGLGKTMMAIISTEQDVQKGWYKRPLFIVPKGVYKKWIDEIQKLFPKQRVVGLGNLGKGHNVNSAADIQTKIKDGDFTIMTYEALSKLGFYNETISSLSRDLNNSYSELEQEKTERAKQLDYSKREEIMGKAKLGGPIAIEDLGFDNLVVDEAHNFKNIFERAKEKEKNTNGGRWGGLQGPSSKRGVKMWFMSQYIQNLNQGRGVKLLTATPFTNNPLEFYNMLSLVAMKDMKQMGVDNINTFMDSFLKTTQKFIVKPGGSYAMADVVEGWQNKDVLTGLIKRFVDFKDGADHGVERPAKIVKDNRFNPTQTQIQLLAQAQELLSPAFKAEGGALLYIDEAKKTTLSPFLSRYYKGEKPTFETFIEESPKLQGMMALIKANQKKTGQVIYFPMGVDYMPLVKEYLVKKLGYKESQVGIIQGQTNDNTRDKIKKQFNEGKIKVVIGSDTIKEGVDLQELSTDLYITSYPWRPTDIVQVEGRIHRQGNAYEKVRINYLSLKDSVDAFLFQKMSTKAKRLADADALQQSLAPEEMDYEDMVGDLITDPAAKLQVKTQMSKDKATAQLNAAKAEMSLLVDQNTKLEELTKTVEDNRAELAKEVEKQSKVENPSNYWIDFYTKNIKKNEKKLATLQTRNVDPEKNMIRIQELEEIVKSKETDLEKIDKDSQEEAKTLPTAEEKKAIANDFENLEIEALKENKTFIRKGGKAVKFEQPKKTLYTKPIEVQPPTSEGAKAQGVTPTIPKGISKEEWIKGQVNAFHGTNKQFQDFALTEGQRSGMMGSTKKVKNQAIFMSSNKDVASFYGRNRANVQGGMSRTIEANIPSADKIVNLSEKTPTDVKNYALKLIQEWEGGKIKSSIPIKYQYWLMDKPEFVAYLKSKGYKGASFNEGATLKADGLELKTEGGNYTTAIFDPKDIVTKSQLSSLYDEGVKQTDGEGVVVLNETPKETITPEEDWQDNYAEQYQGEVVRADEAKKKEDFETEKDANKNMAGLEESFLDKHVDQVEQPDMEGMAVLPSGEVAQIKVIETSLSTGISEETILPKKAFEVSVDGKSELILADNKDDLVEQIKENIEVFEPKELEGQEVIIESGPATVQIEGKNNVVVENDIGEVQIVEKKNVEVVKPTNEATPPKPPRKKKEIVKQEEPESEEVKKLKYTKLDKFRLAIQDRALGIEKTQKLASEELLPEELDIYLEHELYSGAVTGEIERWETDLWIPVIKSYVEFTAGEDSRKQTIQDYLRLSHAPEYNKAYFDGAAGITTQEAEAKLREIEKLPEFPQIEEVGNKIRGLAHSLPKYLLGTELIKKEEYDAWTERYKNYVPYNRILPEDDGFAKSMGIGKGFDVRGKESKARKGSELEVDDILESIRLNWEKAIIRSNKNKVAQTVYRFAKEFKDVGVFKVIKGQLATIRDPDTGDISNIIIPPHGDNIMVAKVKGVQKFIKITDKDVATALKNLDTQKSHIVIESLRIGTRFISMINTSLNPEFFISNMIKDVQSAALTTADKFGFGTQLKNVKLLPESYRDVLSYLRGKKTEGTQMYGDLRRLGGTTGYFNLSDRDAIAQSIDEAELEFSKSAVGFAVKNGKTMLNHINMLNEVIENGTRLSVYKLAIKNGYTQKRAAQIAKNATVNFNKHGTLGPTISALYTFSNASIQGTANVFKTMAKPKTAIKVAGTIALLATLLQVFNRMINEEDYDKIPDYVKETNWVLMLGDDGSYLKLGLPWGYNVIKVATDNVYELSIGKTSGLDSLKSTALSVINAYNPIGGDSLIQSIMPTVFRPLLDVSMNEAWYDAPIYPMNIAGVKDSLNYYDSDNPMFVKIASALSKMTGGDLGNPGLIEVTPGSLEYLWSQYTGGIGRFFSGIGKTATSLVTDPENAQVGDVPFLRKFLGKTNDETYNKGILYDTLDNAKAKILPEETRETLVDSLKLELEAGRIKKKDAQDYLKAYDNDQSNLQQVDDITNYIEEKKMDMPTRTRFFERIADDKWMKSHGREPLNKTQLKMIMQEF